MSDKLKYSIIEGSVEWAERVHEFCRKAYRAAYTRPDLGITRDLFSKEVYNSPRISEYFKRVCTNTEDNKTWLALDENDEIIGMVGAQRLPEYCDMKTFYVRPDLKQHGIGHALYEKVLEFADGQTIQVDVVEYAEEAIKVYEHWGFHIDESKGKPIYPITEWPEEAVQAYRAIYMVKPGKQA